MIKDYPMLAYNSIEKCSKKDLSGKIKVYTKQLIIQDEVEQEFISEKRETSTQTPILPRFMLPRTRDLSFYNY